MFVHHHGSRSFIGNGIDPRAAMTRNRALFTAKWKRLSSEPGPARQALVLDALERARDLEASGRLRSAVELCLEAIRVAPADTPPYLVLAGMLIHSGEWKDALDVLQNLPGGFADARARFLAAQARLALGDAVAARALADSAELDPAVRAHALNLNGVLAEQRGERELATAYLNAALSADHGLGEAYANLGALLWNRDPGEHALQLFERAVVLSPESADALEFYCTAAKALAAHERAVAVLREARGLHPIHRGLTFALIDMLLAGRRTKPPWPRSRTPSSGSRSTTACCAPHSPYAVGSGTARCRPMAMHAARCRCA